MLQALNAPPSGIIHNLGTNDLRLGFDERGIFEGEST
jgi:hypothetical protein